MTRNIISLVIAVLWFASASAGVLGKVFEDIKDLPGSSKFSTEDALKMMATQGWHYNIKNFEMYSVGHNLTDEELNATQSAFNATMEPIPLQYLMLMTYSFFNQLRVYAEEDAENELLDVLIINQANYYGSRIAIYGKMSREDLMLLEAGDVNMGYFGTSIKPMPEVYFQQFENMQDEENALTRLRNDKGISPKDLLKRSGELNSELKTLQNKISKSY